jgi:hypothetical protein
VGEERAAQLLYLAVTSRLLKRPCSIAVKAQSSTGKSYLVQQVLDFFPGSAYYSLTAMSEHALAYSQEPLKHRILVMAEAAGLDNEIGNYLIRSLLSEGDLRYETVEKTKEGLQARLIEREGPTGLIVTTTAVRLHAENETRLLSIPVTDTPEQTKRVLAAIARSANRDEGDGDDEAASLAPWHALQIWLESAEHRVRVPFAERLADLIPPVAVRLRRDLGTLLSLVKAHAILHQATRERDVKGRVVASLTDYETVRGLMADLLAESVGTTVSKPIRETVNAVGAIFKATEKPVGVSQLARHLKLDKSTVSRRVQVCLDLGYLENLELTKGRKYLLTRGEPLPEEQEILPMPDQLTDPDDMYGRVDGHADSMTDSDMEWDTIWDGYPDDPEQDYAADSSDLEAECCTVAPSSEGNNESSSFTNPEAEEAKVRMEI